jgi:DNA polymerase-3 subunit epsilon
VSWILSVSELVFPRSEHRVRPTAIIDFETTGLSPTMGDRATEVAIVLMEGGQVVDRFQSLMNAGVHINAFIASYTGISNAMVRGAAG